MAFLAAGTTQPSDKRAVRQPSAVRLTNGCVRRRSRTSRLRPSAPRSPFARIFLIGAALAMVWPPTQLASKISANRRLIVDLLGGAVVWSGGAHR
jgi:hypothetical protein